MAPLSGEFEAALIDATCLIYRQDPDATSVNRVRRHAEQQLQLDDGFFARGDWKNKSKAIIKKHVDKLLDGWSPEASSKKGAKRASHEADSPKPKRRKHAPQPPKARGKRDSDAGEPEEKPKLNETAAPRKSKTNRQRKAPNSPVVNKGDVPEPGEDDKDDEKDMGKEDASDTPHAQMSPSETKLESDDKIPSATKPSDAIQDDADPPETEENRGTANEEEEYSDVIDELPQPKRKKKDKKEPSSKSAKSAPKKKASASTPDDTDEAEIKKLQSQLVKCGMRKLWHNELKQYGDDARAKIRHLKRMLTDIGMEGRFSEAKARDIKEMRELMADAEAAQEMNALWGMRSGGRASRSKKKPTKADESEASGTDEKGSEKARNDDDDDDDDDSNAFAARRRRAQADLAFLGDDSESD